MCDRIALGAFGFESKTVPLVVYEEGERRVIGESTIIPDSTGLSIKSNITDEKYAKLVAATAENLSGFAIYNPPSKRKER